MGLEPWTRLWLKGNKLGIVEWCWYSVEDLTDHRQHYMSILDRWVTIVGFCWSPSWRNVPLPLTSSALFNLFGVGWAVWWAWHNYGPSSWAGESFSSFLWYRVCSNSASNRHEEPERDLSSNIWVQMERIYPNVAPDPAIYVPRLRITPLGPAPYLMILTEPSNCQTILLKWYRMSKYQIWSQ